MFFSHEHVKSPATKSDIVTIVKTAAEKGQKVRVVGSGHSWSPVATTEEVLVSLWNYSGVVSGRDSTRLCAANSALLAYYKYILYISHLLFFLSLYSCLAIHFFIYSSVFFIFVFLSLIPSHITPTPAPLPSSPSTLPVEISQ